MPTTCLSKPYMKIVDGKEKGRALQLPTRDPLEFRGIEDVPFSQPLVCVVFPRWPRPGLHGPKRPCSGARAVTLAPLAWAPQGNLIQLGQGIPAPSSACSSQTRGVLNAPARLAGRESGWLRRLQWRPLLSLSSSLSQCCSANYQLFWACLSLRSPKSPLVSSGRLWHSSCWNGLPLRHLCLCPVFVPWCLPWRGSYVEALWHGFGPFCLRPASQMPHSVHPALPAGPAEPLQPQALSL